MILNFQIEENNKKIKLRNLIEDKLSSYKDINILNINDDPNLQ